MPILPIDCDGLYFIYAGNIKANTFNLSCFLGVQNINFETKHGQKIVILLWLKLEIFEDDDFAERFMEKVKISYDYRRSKRRRN